MAADNPAGSEPARPGSAPALPPGWLGRWPWVTFILPFAVFAVVGILEPKPPQTVDDQASGLRGESAAAGPLLGTDEVESGDNANSAIDGVAVEESGDGWLPDVPYEYYPIVYTTKIALTVLAMILVWPGYRTFPWRVTAVAVVTGLIGGVLWIVLSKLHLGAKLLGPLGLMNVVEAGRRSAFNPLDQLAANPAWAYGFLAIRLFGLAMVVPVIEEFFLRGFLMRFAVHDQWHQVPFGTVTRVSLIVGTAAPMLMHTGEIFAAAAWFSLVSWLMVRTRNIWDCVVAHAITNAMLGAYVIWSGDWWMM